MKYPLEVHVLYIVYDTDRAIHDDEKFRLDFEQRRECTVFIIR
jgi:hypothetical protein